MAWRFRKSIKIGPLRLNLSKSGLGASIGVRGFRVGQDAKGQSYTAASIPGTGIYERKYSSQTNATGGDVVPASSSAAAKRNSGAPFVLGILLLVFMAGGFVAYLLMPKPIPLPAPTPATVTAPVAPPQPIPMKRRHTHRATPAHASDARPIMPQ
jgi:hypothetical protein